MPARNSNLETRAAVSLLLDGAPHELVAAVCPPLTPANHKKFALDADTYLYHQTRAALDLARDVLGPAELRKHQALSAAEAGMLLQIPAPALRSWCATFIAVPHPDQVVVRGFRPRPDHVLAALAALKKRERKLVAAKPSPQLNIPLGPDAAFGDEADELAEEYVQLFPEDSTPEQRAHAFGGSVVHRARSKPAPEPGLEPAPEPELEPASAPAPAPELEPEQPEPELEPKPKRAAAPRRQKGQQ